MKIFATEYLLIDLESEKWHCRRCNHDLGSARENYKFGLLVHERDPREIHAPILDEAYEFTFAPDPDWVRIIEYYCPECGTMMEVEYLPPGHPLTRDIHLDIDALKLQWATREELKAPILGPDTVWERKHHHH
ncbi:MAG: acetone carboxylase subunit gamma [Parvibaculum sp.]|jgi:acetone carboxylase gamma subunit|uniref:acetone carboxylase subunit gamma n=1 Tax=Parvibaculum sp. TaxID=2024848 RepID=UPI0025D1B023|nr:acetone carboxylase subunit gamma [Parvibaculum sp.]MCE9648472.1 acetone carboxylase subunit gamma [Parvibaculum sp.]